MGFKGGAGALDRKIFIQTRVDPDPVDRQGGPVPDWETVPEICVWAAFQPSKSYSGEFPESEKRQHESYGVFRIRYRPGLSAAMNRVKFILDRRSNPQVIAYYNIESVTEVTRFNEIHLEVSEIV